MPHNPANIAIYALVDPKNRRIRYIGRTENPIRRWRLHLSQSDRHFKHAAEKRRWIDGLKRRGLKPAMMILDLAPEAKAPDVEREWIRRYWRTGYLFNRSKGSRLSRPAGVRLGVYAPQYPWGETFEEYQDRIAERDAPAGRKGK